MQDRFGKQWWRDQDGGGPPPPPTPDTAHYERQWTIVKGARFYAAKRFERRHAASTLAFAVAGVVGFLVPVYQLIFKDISVGANRTLDFTSFATGALSMTLGLYDLGQNHPERARQFHECGKAINRALRRLRDVSTSAQLRHVVDEYEAAIESCQGNHDDIDYEIAEARWRLKKASGKEVQSINWSIRWLKWQARIETFWLYALIWLTPVLVPCALSILQATGN